MTAHALSPHLSPVVPAGEHSEVLPMAANEIARPVKRALLFGVHAFLIHIKAMVLSFSFCSWCLKKVLRS